MGEQLVQIDVGRDPMAAELIRAKCEDQGISVALARDDTMGTNGVHTHRLIVASDQVAAVETLLADVEA